MFSGIDTFYFLFMSSYQSERIPDTLFFSHEQFHDQVKLDREESHHLTSVFRLRKGAVFYVTDGKGRIATCRFDACHSGCINGAVLSCSAIPTPVPSLNVFIGLPAKPAFESALELLTPFGIAVITPLVCENRGKSWWEKSWPTHENRLIRKMIAGIKQARNPWLPVLEPPISVSDAVERCRGASCVADPRGNSLSAPGRSLHTKHAVNCFIGPPGGFSSTERALFRHHSYQLISLGTYRLRTELAAVVMCAGIRLITQEGR